MNSFTCTGGASHSSGLRSMACVLWLHLEYCSHTQRMNDMQRLVEDPGLRESSVSSWRSLARCRQTD